MSSPVATLQWPDYAVMVLYFGASLAIGWWVQRRRRVGQTDFFLGGRQLPIWASAISWYGTAVSSVSMMALPAFAYANDWRAMIVGPLGSVAGFIVAFGFTGLIRRLNTPTIYAYLERRFDRRVRLLVAALGVVLNVFGRSSVIMVLPALALSATTGLNVYLSIVLMGIVTTVYSMEGGFEAVIWTDVMQVAVMAASVVLMIVYASAGVDGGLAGVIRAGQEADRFNFVSWDLQVHDFTALVALGFLVASVFTLISDQPLMQRVLAARDARTARRTCLLGSILGLPNNAIFFFVGTALFAFYQAHPERLGTGVEGDALVGHFIVHELPSGLVGLIIAGIFAAAMSTLSSSLNSVATIVASDFLPSSTRERHGVAVGRWVTVGGGLFATGMALWVASLDVTSLWDQAVRFLALFGGAIPGVFALGLLTRRAHARGVLAGAVAAVGATVAVQNLTSINTFLHSFIALTTCLTVGYSLSLILRPARAAEPLEGMTVWDLQPTSHHPDQRP